MIRKLRKRFVRMAVLVLTAAMVLAVGIVNTANLLSVRAELSGTVKELAENSTPVRPPEGPGKRGSQEAPGAGENSGEAGADPGDRNGVSDWGWMRERSRHFRNLVSESGWFAVYFNAEGAVSWARNPEDIPDLD